MAVIGIFCFVETFNNAFFDQFNTLLSVHNDFIF